ncbi:MULTISPECIES: lipopolysaccharide assembly LapA domain-containing protein [Trichocoleus]|uniref:LapA family protein n=1 Tax=Trichocoleus desertorum GB2-A4 TaxID=2933944 RepID=A0ABV0J5H6_9CYAN|nr:MULTISPECIES: LapA family protein [unclassified Trichocoleus]MBD1861742.1 LapA family protein [Trichocoleus sp. FACHB-46]MBD2098266.1 LapA family protein [Trichocoleus sp. FACHB-591]MBD2123200.1 LapA family protein [Trichocoleus sp. FACHB-262]
MRQINFLIIFVIALALVLFSLENTEPATIHIVRDIQIQAPLAVELILALGVGAVLAWVFSVWAQLQHMLEIRKGLQQVQEREQRIEELEQDLDRYKAELQNQQPLLPAVDSMAQEV